MSREKPEVGDVWIDNLSCEKKRYHIIDCSSELVLTVKIGRGRLYTQEFYIGTFLNEFTYIGKSKVNIDDLFEVQDDRNRKTKKATRDSY